MAATEAYRRHCGIRTSGRLTTMPRDEVDRIRGGIVDGCVTPPVCKTLDVLQKLLQHCQQVRRCTYRVLSSATSDSLYIHAQGLGVVAITSNATLLILPELQEHRVRLLEGFEDGSFDSTSCCCRSTCGSPELFAAANPRPSINIPQARHQSHSSRN